VSFRLTEVLAGGGKNCGVGFPTIVYQVEACWIAVLAFYVGKETESRAGQGKFWRSAGPPLSF